VQTIIVDQTRLTNCIKADLVFIPKSAELPNKNKLVAHRGDPFNFPENTVEGVNAAAIAGAHWAEVDIQTNWADINRLPASYPKRFGTEFDQTRISTFADLIADSSNWPDLRLFIELKRESIDHFGSQRIADDICEKVTELVSRNQLAAIISKHDVALEQVRQRSGLPIGWVVPDHDSAKEFRAKEIGFDYLFINQKRLELWQAGHKKTEQWVIYTINDQETANRYLDAGADMIETDVFGKLASTRPSEN